MQKKKFYFLHPHSKHSSFLWKTEKLQNYYFFRVCVCVEITYMQWISYMVDCTYVVIGFSDINFYTAVEC